MLNVDINILHVNITILHVDIIILHVDIISLNVDIIILHVNIIISPVNTSLLHDDIIYRKKNLQVGGAEICHHTIKQNGKEIITCIKHVI